MRGWVPPAGHSSRACACAWEKVVVFGARPTSTPTISLLSTSIGWDCGATSSRCRSVHAVPVTCRPAPPITGTLRAFAATIGQGRCCGGSLAVRTDPAALAGWFSLILPWASREPSRRALGMRRSPPAPAGGDRRLRSRVLPRKVGRTRGQFVLDGRAASTVVITGTRRGLDCSGFLTWTSSAPLA